MEKWRLIVEQEPRSGAENMAIDEAILQSVANRTVPPTIRFYRWDPPCVTLGYFQQAEKEINLGVINDLGFHLVRRLTGGRAVLHQHELTYSVAVPDDHPLIPSGVVESYKVLSQGILLGIKDLGLSGRLISLHEQKNNQREGSAACFDSPSWYELVIEGKKVVGSAQVRRYGGVLQHGSVLLNLDIPLLMQVFKFPSPRAKERVQRVLERKAAGLRDLGCAVTYQQCAEALSGGFAASLGVELVLGRPTGSEVELTHSLLAVKYSQDHWNLKK
ncbi:MAG: lipoate--protein ligase family protein [bacterium]|jgi:lipoate-protein ligase A